MAEVSETTLRLEILREARERYAATRDLRHITVSEAMLCSLKIGECDAMIRELLKPTSDPTATLARDSIDWGAE